MNISVCVDALYPDIPCEKAIARAANAGASAVEIWGWWDKNIPLVKAAMDENKCQMAALCTRFISLADESCLGDYLKGLDETIAVCKALDCKRIISQVGQSVQGVPADKQHMNLVNGLKAAAKRLQDTDVMLVFEPLNTLVDHRGYYLSSSDEGAQIAAEVNDPHIGMLFDIYHQQIMEGNILSRLRRYLPHIGHIHMAAVPGRGRLDGGELNYARILAELKELGYRHYAALELMTDEPDAEVRQWTKFS